EVKRNSAKLQIKIDESYTPLGERYQGVRNVACKQGRSATALGIHESNHGPLTTRIAGPMIAIDAFQRGDKLRLDQWQVKQIPRTCLHGEAHHRRIASGADDDEGRPRSEARAARDSSSACEASPRCRIMASGSVLTSLNGSTCPFTVSRRSRRSPGYLRRIDSRLSSVSLRRETSSTFKLMS